jgi:sugar lactone lactonase YvrE
MKFSKYLLLGLILLLIGFLLYPAAIDSAPWNPPLAPEMKGQFAPNELLKKSQLLALGDIYGPEDIAIDAEGRVYGGTQDGLIKRIDLDGSVKTWVNTGGRPLGLHFDEHQNLIVCDAFKGLLAIDPDANITLLVNSVDGVPLLFTDDLDIASDGKIYFTDASSKWDQHHYMLDLLEHKPWGRFMVYDPNTKTTTVLLDKLYFANGVALSKNEDFVLVNETWNYRILRYWLKGEKTATHDVFIENLPGFPDGVSSNREGIFWVALPTPRISKVDEMHPKPWLKNIVSKLPNFLKPKPIEYGFVLGLNEQGKVIYNLQDTDGKRVKEITSVQEHQGFLYLGSLHNDRIGKLPLSAFKE